MNKEDEKTNSGFLFGLTLGAAVGALSAILVHKNNDPEIIKNFESKIKDFFQDLLDNVTTKKTESPKKVEYFAVEEENNNQPIIIKRKPAPKMFVKPKK